MNCQMSKLITFEELEEMYKPVYRCENPECNAELSLNDIVYPPITDKDVMHCINCQPTTSATDYFEE